MEDEDDVGMREDTSPPAELLGSSQQAETPPKHQVVSDSSFSSSSPQTVKNSMSFNSINGDCAEDKDVNPLDSSVVESSKDTSSSSLTSDAGSEDPANQSAQEKSFRSDKNESSSSSDTSSDSDDSQDEDDTKGSFQRAVDAGAFTRFQDVEKAESVGSSSSLRIMYPDEDDSKTSNNVNLAKTDDESLSNVGSSSFEPQKDDEGKEEETTAEGRKKEPAMSSALSELSLSSDESDMSDRAPLSRPRAPSSSNGESQDANFSLAFEGASSSDEKDTTVPNVSKEASSPFRGFSSPRDKSSPFSSFSSPKEKFTEPENVSLSPTSEDKCSFDLHADKKGTTGLLEKADVGEESSGPTSEEMRTSADSPAESGTAETKEDLSRGSITPSESQEKLHEAEDISTSSIMEDKIVESKSEVGETHFVTKQSPHQSDFCGFDDSEDISSSVSENRFASSRTKDIETTSAEKESYPSPMEVPEDSNEADPDSLSEENAPAIGDVKLLDEECTASQTNTLDLQGVIASDSREVSDVSEPSLGPEDEFLKKIVKSTPIKYLGFKKEGSNPVVAPTHLLQCNLFNLARKKDAKTGKYLLPQHFESLEPEVAQYLGLQPTVKFKCSNCNMNTFQSMSALNSHKIECKKSGSTTSQAVAPEKNSITVRRRVYMCTICGSYNTRGEIFRHMHEVHKLYNCLFEKCATVWPSPEALVIHFKDVHKVPIKSVTDHESIVKELSQSFVLICLNCKKILTEVDDPSNHHCPFIPKSAVESSNQDRFQRNFQRAGFLTQSEPSSSAVWNMNMSTAPPSLPSTIKLGKDITLKPVTESHPPEHSQPRDFNQFAVESHVEVKQPDVTQDSLQVDSFANLRPTAPPPPLDITLPSTAENFKIKVPSDIEIKPLIPGESHSHESKPQGNEASAIEIFPIASSQPQKSTRKVTRTIIKKTIKKKKIIIGRKKKPLNIPGDNFDLSEFSEDNMVPPVSPPIIAPPPIVRSPNPRRRQEAESAISQPAPSPQAVVPLTADVLPLAQVEGERSEPAKEPTEPSSDELAPDSLPPAPVPSQGPEVEEAVPELAQPAAASLQPAPAESPVPMEVDQTESSQPNSSLPQESSETETPFSSHKLSEMPNFLYNTEPSSHPISFTDKKDLSQIKRSISQDIFKIQLQGNLDSDGESDDSQKLSLVVDENTNNSEDLPKEESGEAEESQVVPPDVTNADPNEIQLAGEDIAAMALTLDDKIENISVQAVVKECVRTSCISCNYCRHAVKIAVNGKQLALHLLSEHRFTPIKNETNDDVVKKLKNSLEDLQTMYFNTESYDSSDPSIHIPYDKNNSFDCFQCSYVLPSHKDLLSHKRKFHTKSVSLCIMCKKNFYSYSELICHLCPGTYRADPQVYSVDINFRCCFCKLDTIPSAFRLMVHLRRSHHTCDICLEICSDQQKLSTHMWKHKLNHICYRCGIAYASKPDITKHLFWKHGTESVLCKKCLQKKWPHVYHFCIPPTSFVCEECNTSFSKAVALKVHKRIHGNDSPYTCPQCEKKFVSKKLLSRHIDRHNAIITKKGSTNKSDESRDEIINVTDVDNKDSILNDNSDSNKEGDLKDKSHKKHKKDKDKKDKKVDVVDEIPPLNLSSESDSEDEKATSKGGNSSGLRDNSMHSKHKGPDMPKLEGMFDRDKSIEVSSFMNLLKQDDGSGDESDRKPTASEPVSPFDSSMVNSLLPLGKDDMKHDLIETLPSDHVEGIWENFYKTNPQNSNLPFPLCAMKEDLALYIIMGDHDYCQPTKVEPVIKEDLPSSTILETNVAQDKTEEVKPLEVENPQTPPPPSNKEGDTSSPKKKSKSPKKKSNKGDDKNSSSSSDSDSSSSSCSDCGSDCSCSSSSSSSSSTSSDSDSSTNDEKKEKRRKKKEKKAAAKADEEGSEAVVKAESQNKDEDEGPQIVHIPEPEDPPIRESELETDESLSDEEFYDKQPQIIANQLLAEKKEKLLGTGTPLNGGSSPLPITPGAQNQVASTPPPQATPPQSALPPMPAPLPTYAQENIPPAEPPQETPKPQRGRGGGGAGGGGSGGKRKRRMTAARRMPKPEKPIPEAITYPKYPVEAKASQFALIQQMPSTYGKLSTPVMGRSPTVNPALGEAAGSGSETDSTRLSKRRRVPNKFYGYSSGDEEEKVVPPMTPIVTPKWKKSLPADSPGMTSQPHTPRPHQPAMSHPPTPRIQLTVPKQVIRKPQAKQPPRQRVQKPRRPSTDSSDSGSDYGERLPPPARFPHHQEPPAKPEKDLYCYCQCPYDEVSEMIACDDENCKIEWFHFECVGILIPPRGQWFCPGCRKARGLPT